MIFVRIKWERKSNALKKCYKIGLHYDHFGRGWLSRGNYEKACLGTTADADMLSFLILTLRSHWLLSSFLLITCHRFSIPLMDVFVAWPEEYKRNCFLLKWNENVLFFLKKKYISVSGENCFVISRFNFHLNLSLIWLELTSPQNQLCPLQINIQKGIVQGFPTSLHWLIL